MPVRGLEEVVGLVPALVLVLRVLWLPLPLLRLGWLWTDLLVRRCIFYFSNARDKSGLISGLASGYQYGEELLVVEVLVEVDAEIR